MQKILVTGSNGLLGQKIIYQLANKEGVDLLATARGENRTLLKDGYHYQSLDITDKDQVKKVLADFKPDTVINTAAMTNVDQCEFEKETCWDANVNAVSYLGRACEELNAHFIHVSTDFIFDGENGPYKEDAEAKPLSYYGESKLAAEKIVKGLNCPWSIVRTVLVYGVIDNGSRSNIVLWAKENLEKGKSLTVVDDQFRTPTLAEDLADGCIRIAKQKAIGVFNISGDDFMCVIDLVKRVARYFNLDETLISPISSLTLSQPAKRPPTTGFVVDKAKSVLGYNPTSFEEGLRIVEIQLEALNQEDED